MKEWSSISHIYDMFEPHSVFSNALDEYMYWSTFKYKTDLHSESPEKSWALLKLSRLFTAHEIEFGGEKFIYNSLHFIQKKLHEFDLKLMGRLESLEAYSDERGLLVSSIITEAIHSAQIEGAHTTTEVAERMLKQKRNPRDESEQMIVNNYHTIQFLIENKNTHLDIDFVIDVHRRMTANTQAAKYEGRLREKGDKEVYVIDDTDGEVMHYPPSHEKVMGYMKDFCIFCMTDEPFVHPIMKASIIHFMIGYIHPFGDGNGRTARALFYWFLLRKGYDRMRYISISRAIKAHQSQYYKAFLKTEYDGNDLTYFIEHSIKMLEHAFGKLIEYKNRKETEQKNIHVIAFRLRKYHKLNDRQAETVAYLYVKSKKRTTISAYSTYYDIVRQTAQRDLTELVRNGYLIEDKKGKGYSFSIDPSFFFQRQRLILCFLF